ncbi:hypothetical protein PTKIN_Ptkin01aG0318000 [Pterospermum kingtungense]
MDGCLEGLSLSDDEDDELQLELRDSHSQPKHLEFCLVGPFLTDKAINFNVMRNRMASIWRPTKGVNIKEIESQLYLFQFFHGMDLKIVIDGGPWSYDNNLLLFHNLNPGDYRLLSHCIWLIFGFKFMICLLIICP